MALEARMVGAGEPTRTLPLAAGALLLGLVVADSTARAGWVTGAVALPSLSALAAAALAPSALTFPAGQAAFVFWFVVLMVGVLLWSPYHASLAGARQRRIELADNARWDFWERGALAAAALVALGVLAPPLSVSD